MKFLLEMYTERDDCNELSECGCPMSSAQPLSKIIHDQPEWLDVANVVFFFFTRTKSGNVLTPLSSKLIVGQQ